MVLPRRQLFTGFVILALLVMAVPIHADLKVETRQSQNGKISHHLIQADSTTSVPKQDILLVTSDAFGHLPENRPDALEPVRKFLNQLPEQVRLHRLNALNRESESFGRFKTETQRDFMNSLDKSMSFDRAVDERFEQLVNNWNGREKHPGMILFLTQEPDKLTIDITPDLLKKLRKNKIVVQAFVTDPANRTVDSSLNQLVHLSGGHLADPRSTLPNFLPDPRHDTNPYKRKMTQLLEENPSDTASIPSPGTTYRTGLSQLVPLHAYRPTTPSNNSSDVTIHPTGYSWTGRRPLILAQKGASKVPKLLDGDRRLSTSELRSGTYIADGFSAEYREYFSQLSELENLRRKLIYDDNRAREDGNNRRPERSASGLVDVLTGEVAIQESLQLSDWRTSGPDTEPRSVSVDSLDAPKLDHLDYQSMYKDMPEQEPIPLTQRAPGNMALFSFSGIGAAFEVGRVTNQWSGEMARSFLDESGQKILKQQVFRRLGVRMNETLEPIYEQAVNEVGVVINDPSLNVTQDLALVMKLQNRGLVKRLMSNFRSHQNQKLQDAKSAVKHWEINQKKVTVQTLRTPNREVSSYVWFGNDVAVVATSPKTLRRIIETNLGERQALADRDDVEYLSRTMDDASGHMVMSDSFITKIIQPDWRLRYDRRKRCLRRLGQLTDRTRTHLSTFGDADTAPRSAVCSPDHSIQWNGNRWVSPVYGHNQFATPVDEITIDSVTETEAERYQEFVNQYQDIWERAVDPIGLSVDVSSDTYVNFRTVILPLINQSMYDDTFEMAREAPNESITSWKSLTSSSVLGIVTTNPYAHFEQNRGDTDSSTYQQWQDYKEQARKRLNWPDDQPMFDWLGTEWGFVAADFAPEDVAAIFSDNPLGQIQNMFSGMPLAAYLEITDKEKTQQFLKQVKKSREQRGRARFQLQKQTTKGDTYYSTNMMGVPLYLGILDDRVVLSLSREFVLPGDSTLDSDSRLSTMAARHHETSQGLVFSRLGQATGLKRFLTPALFPVERYRCQQARKQADQTGQRKSQGPYGGEWFQGPGNNTFCTKHSHFSETPMLQRAFENGTFPVLSENFELKQQLDSLGDGLISFNVSPEEYSASVTIENPR